MLVALSCFSLLAVASRELTAVMGTVEILFWRSLLGCLFIAYCTTIALSPGAAFADVFRFVAAVGFLTFGWALIPFSIWYGHLWSTTAKYLLDALIYGLLVAASFAWLWPEAAA